MAAKPRDVTGALAAMADGASDVTDRLFVLVYNELRRVAHRQLGAEPVGHTLSTTAVVHEAYLKLAGQPRAQWHDRGQFFAVAAVAMRRILVDYARQHRAARRGGGQRPLALDVLDAGTSDEGESGGGIQVAVAERAETLVALDEALVRLAALNPRLSSVVECRFFAGLSEEETATALGVTARTVRRDWVKAKAWLYEELRHNLA
ncbi:MAG: ECF-type sigma factor [Gemmatimonadaceae bacterium]